MHQLREAGIDTFMFESKSAENQSRSIHAVSSTMADGSANIAEPGGAPGLHELADKLFSVEGGTQLRHAAASRIIQWRRLHCVRESGAAADGQLTTTNPRRIREVMQSPLLVPHRWARVQVVNWATDLQRCLLKEQAVYRQSMLDQTAGCVRLASLAHAHHISSGAGPRPFGPVVGRGTINHGDPRHQIQTQSAHDSPSCRHDPLGLLELALYSTREGWYSIQLTSSIVVASTMLVWAMSYST